MPSDIKFHYTFMEVSGEIEKSRGISEHPGRYQNGLTYVRLYLM